MYLERLVIDNIRRIRKEKGISQEKLAEACDTSTSYIGLMEIYRNIPKLSTIEKIAKAMEVDPLMFFTRPGAPDKALEEESLLFRKKAEARQIKSKIMKSFEKEIDAILGKKPN
jgi:transcriptional regulator with XRE-family HTH domain